MKKIRLLPYLFLSVFLGPFFCRSAEPAAAEPGMMERLEKGMLPFRKRDIQLERIEDPVVAKRPFVICHLIFMRTYTYEKQENALVAVEGLEQKSVTRTYEDREYADFAVVPRDSPFLKDNALQLTQEDFTRVPGGADSMIFQKYGIQWKRIASRFQQYTLYLGEDDRNYYFGQGNLSVLMWFRVNFALRGGFAPLPLLADALNLIDTDNFTQRYAINELARFRNAALPELERSLQHSLELDVAPIPHFLCMKRIGTPEADKAMCRYASSDNNLLLNGLFRAFTDFTDMRVDQKPVFFAMLRTRMAPLVAIHAADMLGFSREILPLLQEYVRFPRSFEEYSIGVRSSFSIRTPDHPTPHAEAAGQLILMLMRSGDLPDTLKVYDMEESELARQERLMKEDSERIRPYADIIANSPETDIGILTALELAVYTTRAKGVSPSYIQRIRRAGVNILKRLPRRDVQRAFSALRSGIENDDERQLFETAYRLYLAN